MKVAIIGQSGQLARCLASSKPDFAACSFYGRDRLDLEQSVDPTVLQEFRPDLIVNAAAYTKVDHAEAEPKAAFAVNADGPHALARIAATARIPLIHVSTDYVFDGSKSGEYVETDPVNPINVYGESKCAGETAVEETLREHLIFRTSWVFSEHGQNFVKTMLRLGRTHAMLRVVSDQTGCPTPAAALAVAIWRVAQQIQAGEVAWGTYHLAGSPVTNWAAFAQTIFDDAHFNGAPKPRIAPISASEYPTAAMRPQNSALCCDKFKAAFGFALGPWRDGLRQTLDAAQQQEVV